MAFDHKAHEKYSDSCQACHHAGIEACDKCHTLGGAKKGGFVTFEQAMHLKSRQIQLRGLPCGQAGPAELRRLPPRHRGDRATGRKPPASCATCPPRRQRQVAGLTKEAKNALAENMLKGRNMNPGTYSVNDIPEKVTIKELSDKYLPVELKHREHVLELMKGMKDSPLAALFPQRPGDHVPGLPPQQPALQDAATLRQLPQEHRRPGELRPQGGEPSGAAGGPARPVHELPQGHGGEAGGHGLYRVSQGEEVTGLGL